MYEQARTLRHSEEDKERRREKKEGLGEKKGGGKIPPPPLPQPEREACNFRLTTKYANCTGPRPHTP